MKNLLNFDFEGNHPQGLFFTSTQCQANRRLSLNELNAHNPRMIYFQNSYIQFDLHYLRFPQFFENKYFAIRQSGKTVNDELFFTNGKTFSALENTSHIGSVQKRTKTVKDFESEEKRMGTYNVILNKISE